MAQSIQYTFAGFTFKTEEYVLEKLDDTVNSLSSLLYDLLLVFVQNPGYAFSNDELIKKIWQNKEVESSAVSNAVSRLRSKLGDNGRHPKIIQTLHGNGYRFLPDVKTLIDGIEVNNCNLIKSEIKSSPDLRFINSQSSSEYADIRQEIAEIKDTMRRIDAKLDFLASIVTQHSIWISLMRQTIPKPERARIVYEFVKKANQRLIGPEQGMQISNLESLSDDIQDALTHYRATSSIRELETVVSLGKFWNFQGYLSEGCENLQGAIKRHPEADSYLQAMALAWLSNLSYHRHDYDSATQAASRSINISKQIGDNESLAISLFTLAKIAESKGHYESARTLFTQCLQISQKSKIDWLVSWVYLELGILAKSQENYSFAENWCLKSLNKREDIEDAHGLAVVQNFLSAIACAQGNTTQAKYWVDKTMQNQPSNKVLAYSYSNLGMIEEHNRRYKDALNFYQECLLLYRTMGDRRAQARSLENIAKVTEAMGDDKGAARCWGSAHQIRGLISAPLSPAERKAYGELILIAKKKYFKEFEEGSQLLDSGTTILDS
ncbi:MAG TPA: tetratricopeptide repeat protein [Blastocatellia bacterium]|nr:tetratricopeptide repeat protein [Blastocatellia bacterium]